MLQRVNRLKQAAHDAGVLVIFIRHDEAPEIDGPVHPDIAPQRNEPIISKQTPDSFHETNLQETLAKLNVKNLVIAGFQTEWCVQTTSLRAHDLGYDVTVVEDAHSTFDEGDLTAVDIINRYNEQLAKKVKLVTTDSVAF